METSTFVDLSNKNLCAYKRATRVIAMGSKDNLGGSIQQYPTALETRTEIIQGFWDSDLSLSGIENHLQCDKYFSYYAEQCRLALQDGGRHIVARTHRDIVEVVRHLKKPTLRCDVKDLLRSNLPHPRASDAEDALDNTIDLAVRLLIMVNIGCLKFGVSDHSQLSWRDGSLSDFAKQRFVPCQNLKDTPIKLEKIFNARNLQRIAGIKISWTDNLVDHLSMRDDDTRVAIFHHASFLQYQRNSPHFPPGFIEETIRTLALLLPQHNKANASWYRKMSHRFLLDMEASRCGHLKASDRNIENFSFWHDRLVTLKQVFDEAEPSTISEWWCDRRKGVQWYTFWVAILVLALTILFGAIQCIEGGLQAYKAYYP